MKLIELMKGNAYETTCECDKCLKKDKKDRVILIKTKK